MCRTPSGLQWAAHTRNSDPLDRRNLSVSPGRRIGSSLLLRREVSRGSLAPAMPSPVAGEVPRSASAGVPGTYIAPASRPISSGLLVAGSLWRISKRFCVSDTNEPGATKPRALARRETNRPAIPCNSSASRTQLGGSEPTRSLRPRFPMSPRSISRAEGRDSTPTP